MLYVDITNACPIGCAFCMYLPVQGKQHLLLDSRRTATLKRLLETVSRLSISGEGEPLTQMARVLEVAALAGPSQVVEVITSAGIPWKMLERFLGDLEALALARGFTPRLRVSLDRWHAEKVPHHNHLPLIQRALVHQGQPGTTQVAFRSVTTERAWVTSTLGAQLAATGLHHAWSPVHELTAQLLVGSLHIPVTFKNLVHPEQTGTADPLPLEEYLHAIERVTGRPFTFGNLESPRRFAGPDVTVKHNGQVLLYGLEQERTWSLDEPGLDRGRILDALLADPMLRALYSIPLLEIVGHWRRVPALSRCLDSVNNPYWVLKVMREKHGEAFHRVMQDFLVMEAA
ncbi:hypothetical protein [Corallococcus carmarthensis]|uniref:hypothetical protein n=1 Tax=Corallococcus carmarthensis TaxID=2316728 RepID=UPI0011C3831C|nr:hypothetical protein [Corallococcus carmarthensis]